MKLSKNILYISHSGNNHMENQIFEKILSESKSNKKIIGIRMKGADDDFWCCYVLDYNSEMVILQHFTRYGDPDGLIIEQIENIESIDSDDDYSLAFEYITANVSKIKTQANLELPIKYSGDWIPDLLKHAKTEEILVAIGFNNDSLITGFVKEIDEEVVQLRCIGKLGETEGIGYYRISNVESIQFERMEDRKRRLLYEWNNRIKK